MTSFIGLRHLVTIGKGSFNSFFARREGVACVEGMCKRLGCSGAALAMGECCMALVSLLLTAGLFLSHSIVESASSGGCTCRVSPEEGGLTPGRRMASLGAFVWAPGFNVR